MGFVQVIDIVSVPRTSDSVTFKDITQPYNVTTNPTGFGVPGGPASINDITSVLVQMQFLGEEPDLVPADACSGNLIDGFKFNYTLRDGVSIVHPLYGMVISTGFTANGAVITVPLTGAPFDIEWSNVSYVADPAFPDKLFMVKSLNNATGEITLYSDWEGTTLFKYYDGSKRILVLNAGSGALIKDIANMRIVETCTDPITVQGLINRVLLQISAQASFNCGSFSKAHNAAILLNDLALASKPCMTC